MASSPSSSSSAAAAVPSLEMLALGAVAQDVGGLLAWSRSEGGVPLSAFLAPRARAILLAIAERARVLDEAAIASLVCDAFAALDLTRATLGPHPGATLATEVLPHNLGRLRALSLCGQSRLGPHIGGLFKALAEHCPDLERIACDGIAVSPDQIALIKQTLPIAPARDAAGDAESWEDVAASGAAPWVGRLTRLRELAWRGEGLPPNLARWIRERCTRFRLITEPDASSDAPIASASVLHGSPELTIARVRRAAANLCCPTSSTRCGEEPSRGYGGEAASSTSEGKAMDGRVAAWRGARDSVPLAERFRYAYILRAQRLAKKAERERQRLKRKEKRAAGARGARNVLEEWLDE